MDKEIVVHIHNEIYSGIKRNVFESVLMRWMNLEPIIQSEVSQKKKTNIIYMQSRKIVLINYFQGIMEIQT